MKKNKYIYIGLIIAIIGLGAWGAYQYNIKQNYSNYIDNQFKRKYYDLVGSVETISTELSKLMVSTQTKENIVLYSKIWQNAYNAEEYLSQLPIDHKQVNKIAKFLNQLGDYTFAMAQKSIKDKTLSTKDIDNLENLNNYAVELSEDLHKVEKDAVEGKVWQSIFKRKKSSQKLNQKAEKLEEQNPIQVSFAKFEERMTEYPELIYDGPFSENVIEGVRPKLKGEKITKEQASEKVKEFIGKENINKIDAQEGTKGRINTFSFIATSKNNNPIFIDISETKGYVVYLLNNRNVAKSNISRKQAIDLGNKFLNDKGYKNMMPTYSLKTNNVVLINYAYKQNDVIMYPDLIKVKIALDNGEIVGFDSTNYLTLNYQRDVNPPKLSPEEAKTKVSIRAKIEEEPQLCYIPTSFSGEIYCYEIKVIKGDEHFLIYINADTGIEEKILKTIISENGVLMI